MTQCLCKITIVKENIALYVLFIRLAMFYLNTSSVAQNIVMCPRFRD
jgi:hypothetical protein